MLVRWLLPRLALGGGLLAAGRGLDRWAGFRPFEAAPGLALLPILAGLPLCVLALRELAAGGGLAECGPYLLVRHPLELGWQLTLLGAALFLGTPGSLLTAGPLALLLWVGRALLQEEPALRRRFGAGYERWRRDTGLLFPSMYVWSLLVVYIYYRLWCGLRVRGRELVPRRGPFFLVSLHRSYGDPFIVAHNVPRKVHFIATAVLFRRWLSRLYFKALGCIPLVRHRADLRPLVRSFRLLDSGGVVMLFPEGARSWCGESACEPAVFKLLERRRVPIVTAEIAGAFEHHPRFSRRLRPAPLRLTFRLHPPGSASARQLLAMLLRREQEVDRRRRTLARPLAARDAERMIYLCPDCALPFRLRGEDSGRLRCRACGREFTLLEGKGLRLPDGAVKTFPELEKAHVAWSAAYDPRGRRIAGRLVHRLAGLRKLQRHGHRGLGPGALVLHSDHLVAEGADRVRIPYDRVDSVLVEGNSKLELTYRAEDGRPGFLRFASPGRYPLFLQHFLRLKAFANPYARYRGSSRRELPSSRA